jgi:serine/threonine-protein kinase ULK3
MIAVDESLHLRSPCNVIAGNAMYYLHHEGVAHFDLKPQNVLLSISEHKEITLKVADFGLSLTVADLGSGQTFRGTPLYTAPEVFAGDYDTRADIYSAGVILYELIFRTTPFVSKTVDDLLPLLARCTAIAIPSLHNMSAECIQLLTRMLCMDVTKRISFAQLFADPFLDLAHIPSPDSLARYLTWVHVLGDLYESELPCYHGHTHCQLSAV